MFIITEDEDKKMVGGNKDKILYKITKTQKENNLFYSDNNICGNIYNIFLNNALHISNNYVLTKNNNNKKLFFKCINSLNNYVLVSGTEIEFRANLLLNELKKDSIPVYKPLTGITFYAVNEIFTKFNILSYLDKSSNILYIGSDYNLAELTKYKNYKLDNITAILLTNNNYYKNNIEKWYEFIKNNNKIYEIEIILFNKKIYELLNIDYLNGNETKNKIKKYNLLYYNSYNSNLLVLRFENHYNTIIILTGALLGLKHTEIGGIFILYFGSVAYKHLADIYVIIAEYFDNHSLYYPEISNLYKKTGTYGIFTGFKGISDIEFNELLKLLDKTNEIYPNDGNDFNIYDEKLREELHITKPINPNISHQTNIIGYLDDKLMNDNNYNKYNKIYEYIRNFNNERYYKQLSFVYKMLELLKKSDEYINNLKIPNPEQLTNAILYCKKYDIAYIDKYSKPTFQDKFGKQILHEAYGLHEPIIYTFKTPFKLHLGMKSRTSLKLDSRYASKHASKHTTKYNSITNKPNMTTKTHKTKKFNNINNNSYINFNNDSFRFSKLFSKSHKSHKPYKTHKPYKSISKSSKHNQHAPSTANLIPELEFSNNRIEQTTKLIDSRRDFDAPDSPNDMQNEKWFEANKRFRYYKHKDDKEKIHLDVLVRNIIKDNSVSQAWLKMYEIITDCNLIPTNRKGVYKSFHICEAPGTFISCLNNYIHTKTKYDKFEWKAQSLRKNKGMGKDTAFGDDFGLIRRHRNNWDWGVDGTGDITNIENIQHYAKVVKEIQKPIHQNYITPNTLNHPIDLITSDCGIPMKCE